jgi:hypothetical protein
MMNPRTRERVVTLFALILAFPMMARGCGRVMRSMHLRPETHASAPLHSHAK